MHHIQSSYKAKAYIRHIGYRVLTYQLYNKTRLKELGNRLQRYHYGYTEARKSLLKKKTLWGEKTTGNLGRNHGPNSMQLAPHPTRLYSSNKINFKTKSKTWQQRKVDGWFRRPRWLSRAILPLIYHCIITHDAQA